MSSLLLWPEGTPGALGETEEDRPTLVPYPVKGERPTAAVVVCPGGGYVRRAPHEAEPIALWLNSLGISAFVVHYRVAPYRYPQPLKDAQRAIRLVREGAQAWGIDPNRVGILGFSAGGHVASTAGTMFEDGNEASPDPVERHSSRPDAMILCYPVISLVRNAHQGSRQNLLGEETGDEALAEKWSTELRVSEQTPPTFIWHTADDASVPLENALMFASALSANRIPLELHVYESGRHGLGLAEEHPAGQWTAACASWLTQRGFRD